MNQDKELVLTKKEYLLAVTQYAWEFCNSCYRDRDFDKTAVRRHDLTIMLESERPTIIPEPSDEEVMYALALGFYRWEQFEKRQAERVEKSFQSLLNSLPF